MDESTTTPTDGNTGVEASTQPAETTSTEAGTQTAETTTEPNDSPEAGDSQQAVDDNLKWLQENKGIDPTSPEAMAKVAEMYRNAEKAMHDTKKPELKTELQETSEELETQYQDDPVAKLQAEVRAMKMESTVNNFFTSNPDAKQYEAKMTEMVNADPNLKVLVNNGYLGIENLYQMAKGADSSREQSLKTDGGREALQKVAYKQQAKAVTPAASSSQMATQGPTKETVNDWYAGLTSEQRSSPETQRTLASLLS